MLRFTVAVNMGLVVAPYVTSRAFLVISLEVAKKIENFALAELTVHVLLRMDQMSFLGTIGDEFSVTWFAIVMVRGFGKVVFAV
jgi:hypothetical protein